MRELALYHHIVAVATHPEGSQKALRKWAARGKMPMHRNLAKGYRLFKQSDLDHFLKKTATPAKPKA